MPFFPCRVVVFCLLASPALASAADAADIKPLLAREIVGPRQARLDVEELVRRQVPRMPTLTTREAWEEQAARTRAAVLDRVIFRGAAARWRDAKAGVRWLQTIEGGPGYRIHKLRYEALPGLWVPALLYEPLKLKGKVPAVLNVNGHDPTGKAAPYKQARCINLAKRGMLALNVEWLGMGQLRAPGYSHGRMNQLDLCGTSGLAPFYLCMSRGLDVLLAHKYADPERVAVAGLSGGGWQTIFISALDTRVKLSNPVAGYSGFLTRVEHHKDLGDSEQTPSDLATVADYTHLTALLAPRPALLTYNAKDDCCFESGYALPPLLDAARPVYKLLGKEGNLRSHVNHDPGTHNFAQDNREALYRMLGDHFFPDRKDFDWHEIPSDKEVRKPAELEIELPKDNANFNTLASGLAKSLPEHADLPKDRDAARRWQQNGWGRLEKVLDARLVPGVAATTTGTAQRGNVQATFWKIGPRGEKGPSVWTVPVVELVGKQAGRTALLIGDLGRRGLHDHAAQLIGSGYRVFVLDPFYRGECQPDTQPYLFALLVSTVGRRPLGMQVEQILNVASWIEGRTRGDLHLVAVGPRCGVAALAAAGASESIIDAVTLHEPLGSLKQVLEENRTFDQSPELFCFGLLEQFDVRQLAALVAPRPLRVVNASERARQELAGLKSWYATLGKDFDPFGTD